MQKSSYMIAAVAFLSVAPSAQARYWVLHDWVAQNQPVRTEVHEQVEDRQDAAGAERTPPQDGAAVVWWEAWLGMLFDASPVKGAGVILDWATEEQPVRSD